VGEVPLQTRLPERENNGVKEKTAAHCDSLVQEISCSVEVVHDTECVITTHGEWGRI